MSDKELLAKLKYYLVRLIPEAETKELSNYNESAHCWAVALMTCLASFTEYIID